MGPTATLVSTRPASSRTAGGPPTVTFPSYATSRHASARETRQASGRLSARESMHTVTDLPQLLTERLARAFTEVAGEPTDPAVRRSERADYQADGALPLAKTLRRPP